MLSAKVSSTVVEVLSAPDSSAKASQMVVEVLRGFTPPVAVTGPLVPAMTSDTAPSGTVTYSSQYYAGWWAFSGGTNQGWLNNGSALPQWLGYQFPTAKTVRRYQMRQYSENYASGNRRIKTWKFQGSSNGTDWTDLDTQTNYVWPTNFTTTDFFTFEIASPASYAYYRVYITGNYGDGYTGIGGLQMSDNLIVSVAVSQAVVEVLKPMSGSAVAGQLVIEVLVSGDGASGGGGGGSPTPVTHAFGYAV